MGDAPTSMWLAVMACFAAIVFFSFVMLLAKRYKRCPSNSVMVIYGKLGTGDSARCIHGGAAFIWPLIQDYAFLTLEPMQIEIPLKDALSMENIRVCVPSVFTVAIGTEQECMQNAAIRLLGLNQQQVKKQAEDMIFGQLRQVIASMQIDDINRDREKFLHNIQSSLEPELLKIGLVLINVNITDITDESGYIEAIGKKAASQAIQQARGDVAEQVRMGEIRVAEAEKEKLVRVAEATREREIGMRNAIREQAVKIAELDRDQQIGENRAAFERESQIKDAERQKRIAIAEANSKAIEGENVAQQTVAASNAVLSVKQAEANAKAIEGENLAQQAVAASNAQLAVKQAEAYQLGEARKREAEAHVLEAQNIAMTKAAIANAERVEAERRAEVEAPAKAEKAKVIVEAEAAAQRKRIEAEAEAAAIYMKLEAEAKGQFEILAKKGDGLKRIVEACGGSQQAFQMLMLEHMNALADASSRAISNIKFDKIVVWEGNGKDGTSSTASFLHNLAKTMPPILQVMKDIGGVEVPEYLAKFTAAEDAPKPVVKPPATEAPHEAHN